MVDRVNIARHTTRDIQNQLVVERGLQDAFFQVVIHVAQHTGVKDFNFGLDVQLLGEQAQPLQEGGRVQEDVAVGPVHGAGVVGAHLRLQDGQVGHPHILGELGAGGGDIDDGIQVVGAQGFPDHGDHLHKAAGLHGVRALVIADMDVQDAGAGPNCGQRIGDQLLRRQGDVGGLLAGGTAAAEGAGDHKLVCFHNWISLSVPSKRLKLRALLENRYTSGANIALMHTICKDATCHFSVMTKEKRRLLSNVTIFILCILIAE